MPPLTRSAVFLLEFAGLRLMAHTGPAPHPVPRAEPEPQGLRGSGSALQPLGLLHVPCRLTDARVEHVAGGG